MHKKYRTEICIVNMAPIGFQHEVQFTDFKVLFKVKYDCLGQTEGAEFKSGHSLRPNSLFLFRLASGIWRDGRYLLVMLCVLK